MQWFSHWRLLINDVVNQEGIRIPRLQWNVVKRWLTFIRNATMRRCEIHEHEAMNRLRFFYQSWSHLSYTIIVPLEVILCFHGCKFVINVHYHHHCFSFSSNGCCCKHSPSSLYHESSEYSTKRGGACAPPLVRMLFEVKETNGLI